MAKKVKSSEVHAYTFIKETLGRLGWSVKNPLKSPDGQVYTQQECLGNERIAEQLGLLHPENVVLMRQGYYSESVIITRLKYGNIIPEPFF